MKLTTAERIAAMFDMRWTELHRSAVEQTLRISDEQFDNAKARAREIAKEEHGLFLTPIYDTGREGWWTGHPTKRLIAIALDEENNRERGAAERNLFVYEGFDDAIEEVCRHAKAGLAGTSAMIETTLVAHLSVDPAFDYVIKRVDNAIAENKLFVEAESGSQVAAA